MSAFAEFAHLAAEHHEKLDGSGYPWGLTGERLSQESRVLPVADIYEALTAHRPYRAGMDSNSALTLLRKDAGARLCERSVDALHAHLRTIGAL